MISETSSDMIVHRNVSKLAEAEVLSKLEQYKDRQEVIAEFEDKEKKASLNFERMSSFLGIQIDSTKVFVVPVKEKSSIQALLNINNGFSDGFYDSVGDFIVVYASKDETDMSMEQKIVHESFHKAGLRNMVISRTQKGDDYSYGVNSPRMGFALIDIGENPTGNSSPGLLLEEMAASYAGFAYTQHHADKKYQQQIDEVFASGKADQLTKQLGKKYALLNSQGETMGFVSLCAFLFDVLRVKLGMDEKTPLPEVVQSAIRSRQDVSSIREFISKLEEILGKGSYATLRGIDISGSVIDANALQKAINLIAA